MQIEYETLYLHENGAQLRQAADAAFARSVEDRLRTNDSFTALAAQLRNG